MALITTPPDDAIYWRIIAERRQGPSAAELKMAGYASEDDRRAGAEPLLTETYYAKGFMVPRGDQPLTRTEAYGIARHHPRFKNAADA